MGSLDFVSPRAILVGTALLKSPVEIFADIMDIAGISNPNAFAALEQSEQALNFNLKEDLLRHLGGELTLELDNITAPVEGRKRTTPVAFRINEGIQGAAAPLAPVWKVILGVDDPNHLQQTFGTLLAAFHIAAQPHDDPGVTSYTVRLPTNPNIEIAYTFVDGYLVIASSRETLAEAIRLHRAGESLGKSKKFLAALPPGHPSGPSAVLFEDPIAMAALQIARLAPEMAGSFAHLAGESAPVVVCGYGEERAIREASNSAAFDAGAVLVVAAAAIPNLLRSRVPANEASAVRMIRTLNTAQITYAASYPDRGYARDLATLGPDPTGTPAYSPDHAGLIDATLGNANCTAGTWCTKSGYRFTVTAVCKQQLCKEYVAVGTPVDSSTGGRNFCSTSDGMIRLQTGPPLTGPINVSECRAWPPLQ